MDIQINGTNGRGSVRPQAWVAAIVLIGSGIAIGTHSGVIGADKSHDVQREIRAERIEARVITLVDGGGAPRGVLGAAREGGPVGLMIEGGSPPGRLAAIVDGQGHPIITIGSGNSRGSWVFTTDDRGPVAIARNGDGTVCARLRIRDDEVVLSLQHGSQVLSWVCKDGNRVSMIHDTQCDPADIRQQLESSMRQLQQTLEDIFQDARRKRDETGPSK